MNEKEHTDAHKALEEDRITSKLRFENGQKAMDDLRAKDNKLENDLTTLKETIAPKPVNWPYIVFSSIGVLAILLTAWFALGTKFSDRPTRNEMDKQIQSLVNGQVKLTDTQVVQQRMLDKLVEKQEANDRVMTDIRQDIRTLLNRR